MAARASSEAPASISPGLQESPCLRSRQTHTHALGPPAQPTPCCAAALALPAPWPLSPEPLHPAQVTSAKDQSQYWGGRGPWRFVPGDAFVEAFAASGTGRATQERLAQPLGKDVGGPDALQHKRYAVTGARLTQRRWSCWLAAGTCGGALRSACAPSCVILPLRAHADAAPGRAARTWSPVCKCLKLGEQRLLNQPSWLLKRS